MLGQCSPTAISALLRRRETKGCQVFQQVLVRQFYVFAAMVLLTCRRARQTNAAGVDQVVGADPLVRRVGPVEPLEAFLRPRVTVIRAAAAGRKSAGVAPGHSLARD